MDLQHLLYKLKTRNDEAYKAYKVMSPADLDDEVEQRWSRNQYRTLYRADERSSAGKKGRG